MFHTVSDKKYRALANRNAILSSMGFRGIDPRMVRLVRLLDLVDGIQTVWSCSGHTIAERHERWMKKNPDANSTEFKGGKYQECYFIFAAGRNSEPFLKMLSDLMQRSKFQEWNLNAITLNWGFNPDGTHSGRDLKKRKSFDPYPVWEFGFRYNTYNWDEFDKHMKRLVEIVSKYIIIQYKSKD